MAEDVFVRSLARFLVVFMALRMLAPPGVCLCELSLPLVRFLAEVFHSGGTPIPCDEEGDDTGGCICQLPAGVRAEPVAPPPRPTASPELPVPFAAVPSSAPDRFAGAAASTSPPRPGHFPRTDPFSFSHLNNSL